jgi:hypothetical protein
MVAFPLMLTIRALAIGRRLAVALIAMALSAQVLQGLEPRCVQMDMDKTAMTDMASGSMQSEHPSGVVPASSSDKSDQTPPASSCLVGNACIVAAALPAISQPQIAISALPVGIGYLVIAPSARAVRPEAPPPRI